MTVTRPVITPLADDVKYWNALLGGDSGVGKTVFAGSDLRVLFLAPEDDGLMSAQRMGSRATKILIKHWLDIKNAYEWYETHPEELKDFDVLSIDSLPEMQRKAKEYVLEVTAHEKLRKNQDPEKMQLQDYGTMHDLVENMVRGFNDLPINVLWTSTSKKVEDADKREFMVPDLQGKGDYGFAMKMVALMTSYGFMRVEVHDIPDPTEDDPKRMKAVRRRVIYWEDTGTIRGKDRTCSLAPFTVNMTLQQMRRCIAGELKRGPDGRIVKPATVAVKAVKAAPKKPVVQASPQPTDKVESVVIRETPEQLAADEKAQEATKQLDTVEA